MSNHDKNRPDGLWDSLTRVEATTNAKLKKQLDSYYQILRDIYEAGIQATTLPLKDEAKGERSIDLKVCGMLLKRVLTDLRGVWLLISYGYTSQAATVTSSLFEMANAINLIAGDEQNAKLFLADRQGDLPWSPIKLCQLVTKRSQKKALSEGKPYTNDEYELNWRALYIQYKWLCKIKHPTMPSLFHGTLSTIRKPGEYVIMALPDSTALDFPTKIQVLTIAALNTFDAIKQFSETMEINCDKENPYFINFTERITPLFGRIAAEHRKLPDHSLAFDVSNTEIYKEFERFEEKVRKSKMGPNN